MLDKEAELNRVLIAINSVIGENGEADFSNVISQCESMVIEGRLPDHQASIDFAIQIEFIQKIDNKLTIIENGKIFLELNPNRFYDLSDNQKRMLLRTCYLHGPLRLPILDIVRKFSPDYEEKTYKLSMVEMILK